MSAVFTEAAGAGRWRIRVIRAGLSGNLVHYPDDVLRRAVPLFEGARVFVKGDAEHLAGGGKDFRNLIGRVEKPEFVAGADGGEIQADLRLIDPDGEIAAKLRHAWDNGMAELFGFSIDAAGSVRPGRMDGRPVRVATRIDRVASVDLIIEPGAGGQIVNLIESKQEGGTMDEHLSVNEIKAALATCGLPAPAQARLAEELAPPATVTEADLREAVERERSYIAQFSESGRVRMGDFPRIEPGESRFEKTEKMLDAFFDPEDRSVVSIRECYVRLTGDTRITGAVRNCDPALMREALDSQSFPAVLGDSIARRMIRDYRTPSVYGIWRNLANVVPVNDFRTQERTRFGGYGDIPIVGESQPYTALDSPDDEKATYAVAKRGGTEEVTLEMITNDDVGAVQQIPRRLARAAQRTLSKFVLDFLRTNPTIYDDTALFHVDHDNLGTAALSKESVSVMRLKMMQQTEKNSGDRLGIGPRYLWVPGELEETAVDLFRRNTENDRNFIQSLSLDVMPVWYWEDPADWYASADPLDIPNIEIGFLNGAEDPELFIQDSPTVGAVFSHDKITYKIRHIYGGTVTDYRGLFAALIPE